MLSRIAGILYGVLTIVLPLLIWMGPVAFTWWFLDPTTSWEYLETVFISMCLAALFFWPASQLFVALAGWDNPCMPNKW